MRQSVKKIQEQLELQIQKLTEENKKLVLDNNLLLENNNLLLEMHSLSKEINKDLTYKLECYKNGKKPSFYDYYDILANSKEEEFELYFIFSKDWFIKLQN